MLFVGAGGRAGGRAGVTEACAVPSLPSIPASLAFLPFEPLIPPVFVLVGGLRQARVFHVWGSSTFGVYAFDELCAGVVPSCDF